LGFDIDPFIKYGYLTNFGLEHIPEVNNNTSSSSLPGNDTCYLQKSDNI